MINISVVKIVKRCYIKIECDKVIRGNILTCDKCKLWCDKILIECDKLIGCENIEV